MGTTAGHRWGSTAPAVAALLLLAGCGSGDVPAPSPSSSVSAGAAPSGTPTAAPPTPAAVPAAPPASAPATPAQPAVLPPSAPVTLEIPSIGVRTELLGLGLRANRTLEVPPDGPGAPASWYNRSPAPGVRGPSVMLGHVNATDGGKGVFADLRQLRAGDRMSVVREDGTTAVFEVQRGEAYRKDDFPTLTVYGNTPGAELRLITCDGYDPGTGAFDDNYVVYAALVP